MSHGKMKDSLSERKDTRGDQKYDYLLILDFEATCDVKKGNNKPQEIIEFPCLKLDSRTLEIEGAFHQYVSPTAHPKLSKFCTELTGITQVEIQWDHGDRKQRSLP